MRARALLLGVIGSIAMLPSAASGAIRRNPPGVICLNTHGTHYVVKHSRPRACALFGSHGDFATGINLAKLRWYRYGGDTATATGQSIGFHKGEKGNGVGVQLYRPRHNRCGYVYTRMSLSFTSGHPLSRQLRLRSCPGAA